MTNELRKVKPFLVVVAVLSTILLAWFHASLWFGQGSSDESAWRLASMALLSDAAQVVLFAAGMYLVLTAVLFRVRLLGTIMILVALFLAGLSIVGVFGSLSVQGAKKSSETAQLDPAVVAAYKTLSSTFTDQIASLKADKALMPDDWHSKKLEIDGKIADASDGLLRVANSLQAAPPKDSSESAFFSGVAGILGWTEKDARMRIYGAYAVLLALVALLSTVVAFFGESLANIQRQPKTKDTVRLEPDGVATLVSAPQPTRGGAKSIKTIASAARAESRELMEKYLEAAFADIEANGSDSFLGRNKIMERSGLDRSSVEWCSRQLIRAGLVETTQEPQRTLPVATRKELLEKLFGTPAVAT